MKPFLKPAAAALLSFTIAPLCAAQSPFDILSQDTDRSVQEMGFTEADQTPPFITNKVIPDDTPDDELTFSLDLYFGTGADAQPVRGIAPLIVYNSNQIKVVGISNIANAGILRPARAKLKKYISDYTPATPPALTIARESVPANANKSLALTWLDRNGIAAVSEATPEQPVRVATIKFQWILGSKDTSHIGITRSEFGVARIRGASIEVKGPAVRASVSSQTTNINVNNDASPISVKCSLSRPLSGKTTCFLELALDRPNPPPATTVKISIRAGKTSASKKFKIRPNAADSGSKLKITLKSVLDEKAEPIGEPPEISLESPAVVISKPDTEETVEEITVEEGETEELRVRLAAPPNGKVIVRARADFHTTVKKVTITPASLTFTAKNWNQRQPVSVSSADDKIADGNRSVTVGFGVNSGKSGATDYDNASAASVRATITDNDIANLAVTVKPENILAAGAHPITITATLKGGGVFRTATEIELRPKKTGSAEDARYVPSTLPSKIIIPARAASARTAFTLHLARATAGAIVVGVGATFSGSTVKIPDVRVLIDRFTWDVDENNFLDSSDAILIGRHLDMGFPGPALVRGIHTTDDHEAVLANLRRGESVLNVGELPPPGPNATPEKKRKFANQTGRLLLRYFQGYRGERLVKGQDPRLDWATVETNIKAYMPRRFLGI